MFQKYTDALALMDTVIELHEAGNEVHAKWDELFEYMDTNFSKPELCGGSTVEITNTHPEFLSTVEMFKLNREEMEHELYKIPPEILEQCFPIWIVRYLLCISHRKVELDLNKATKCNQFFMTYGRLVIRASALRK